MPVRPKLYQYAVCPFCWKVKAILNYKRIPYETVEVNPINKKEIAFSPDYKKVPIYIDLTGRQLNDSTPIMRHIDKQYPQERVFEIDQEKVARENEWLKWSDETFVKSLPPLIYNGFGKAVRAFDYITEEGKFSWFQRQLIRYSGAFFMSLVAKKSAKRQGITDPVRHFQNCLKALEHELSSKSYLMGKEKPNGADLAIWGILASIRKLPDFKWVKENPAVHAWFKRVESLAQIS